MKVFECIIDDGQSIFKSVIPATNRRTLISEWSGNGEFVKIKEVTQDFPISIDKVIEALEYANFGETEKRIITIALDRTIENKL